MAEPSVAVLRRDAHGMPLAGYAEALRERLPDHEVRIARTPAAQREAVADYEVVSGFVVDADLLDRADAMELFACGYAGVGHLPMDVLRERGVAVTNASGVHGPNVSEHVVGTILAFVCRFPEAWRRGNRREWRHFRTHELQDSTVTVVGLGAIGPAVVERLRGFGVDTVGVRYRPEKGGPTDEVVGRRYQVRPS
ncbi:hypothetical protein BRC81_11815 [Halobacteriales archaeon QS_1_68_20]|nr:MAG: hypothetical protein BRC81_11815 [Halobacteriales archaeon QS_1_68_20]